MDNVIFDEQEIATYYADEWSKFVKWWNADKTLGIHTGYYEKGIHTHVQAIFNMNDLVGKLLCLQSPTRKAIRILDAGCGVGGTSIYLAKKYPNINFIGLTIVPEQVKLAKKFAKENRVSSNTEFVLGDFIETGFSNASFDGIFALQSMEYAKDKNDFIHEMYRILKPGGRLAIISGFSTATQRNFFVQALYSHLLRARMVPNLVTVRTLNSYLKKEGFMKIKNIDLTKNIIRPTIRAFLIGIPHLFYVTAKKMIKPKYKLVGDANYSVAVSVLEPTLGIYNALTFEAITAVKK